MLRRVSADRDLQNTVVFLLDLLTSVSEARRLSHCGKKRVTARRHGMGRDEEGEQRRKSRL